MHRSKDRAHFLGFRMEEVTPFWGKFTAEPNTFWNPRTKASPDARHGDCIGEALHAHAIISSHLTSEATSLVAWCFAPHSAIASP